MSTNSASSSSSRSKRQRGIVRRGTGEQVRQPEVLETAEVRNVAQSFASEDSAARATNAPPSPEVSPPVASMGLSDLSSSPETNGEDECSISSTATTTTVYLSPPQRASSRQSSTTRARPRFPSNESSGASEDSVVIETTEFEELSNTSFPPTAGSTNRTTRDDGNDGTTDLPAAAATTTTTTTTTPSTPHPNLKPMYMPWTRDVFSYSQIQRAKLYTVELRTRDEAIVSAYTDPVELELIETFNCRILAGRYFQKSTLEQLYERSFQHDGVVKNPWNPSETWTLEQVVAAANTELPVEDQQRIAGAVHEYHSRFALREAWEAQRNPPASSVEANRRLIQGQASTQPSILQLRCEEAERERLRLRSLLRQAQEAEEEQEEGRLLRPAGDEQEEGEEDPEEQDEEGEPAQTPSEDPPENSPLYVRIYQQILQLGRSLSGRRSLHDVE